MSTEPNRAIVTRLVEEIFNQGNLGVVDELIAPDFVEHEELPPGTPPGRDGVIALISAFRGAFPDFTVTIEDIVAEGDKVVVRTTWGGTQHGEFMGLPPTGKRFSITVIDIIRVVDGRCAEHWGVMDAMAMMQQLGAIPA